MIIEWIEKTFNSEKITSLDIFQSLENLNDSKELSDLSNDPKFVYELAKVNTTAAFILWQNNQQQQIKNLLNKEDILLVNTNLFPAFQKKDIHILNKGKIYSNNSFRKIEKPLAFRELPWLEIENLGVEVSTYNLDEFNKLLKGETYYRAAIVAGAKFKSYALAAEYSTKRIQGGKTIGEWSLIRSLLNELYLSVKTDEALLKDINDITALAILKNSDHFVNQNMQIFGGAGYTEDYAVERLYRDCIFLKNWPMPFKQMLTRPLE